MKIFGIIVLIIVVLAIIIFSLKDPDTGKSYWHNFVEAYGRFKNIYHELQEKRKYPDTAKEAQAVVDSTTAASGKEEKPKEDAVSGASHEDEKPKEDAASGASHKEQKPLTPKKTEKPAPQHITLGEKAHDFIDAASAASFKTIDHKKLLAKLTGKDKKEK